MSQMKEKMEEENAIKIFKAKLAMAKINLKKRHPKEAPPQRDRSGHFTVEFDITSLPLKVKKNIITAGIIQGLIYECGDGQAHIREIFPSQGTQSVTSKTLYLCVQATDLKSYENAIGIVETLVDEVLDHRKKIDWRPAKHRSWGKVSKIEYEIQHLMRPVISHLITKGIMKGELYLASGTIVSANGSPYMADDLPDETFERPVYLLIQGPNDKSVSKAVEVIHSLIKEAEEILNNDIPEVIAEVRPQPTDVLDSANIVDLTQVTPARHQHTGPVASAKVIDLTKDNCDPPFLPQLGESIEADVKRCVMLVQWLLAHPLLVSFFTLPPFGCQVNKFSGTMIMAALQCLPLYNQYENNQSTSKRESSGCVSFRNEALNATIAFCETVIREGYDISKLISVDDYIKKLEYDPKKIGVLYDYPLPLNLYNLDCCRLFIDVVINCGIELEVSHIESYLRSTNQWYPIEAFKGITVCSRVKPCPSKNRKTHKYPLYGSFCHLGGLINFSLDTISHASPQKYFPPDAMKIPRCKDFPFLNRLAIFSNLRFYNEKNKRPGVLEPSQSNAAHSLGQQPSTSTVSEITPAVTQAPCLQAEPQPSTSKYTPNNIFGGSQIAQDNSRNPFNNCPNKDGTHPHQTPVNESLFSFTTNTPTISKETGGVPNLPPSFLQMRNHGTPTMNPSFKTSPSSMSRTQKKRDRAEKRKAKADMRKEKEEKRKEAEREEINKTLEKIKEKCGTNSFWTIDPARLNDANAKEKLINLLGAQTNIKSEIPQFPPTQAVFGSLHPPNLQNALSMLQTSMPGQKPTLFGARPPVLERNPPLKPPILNAQQLLENQRNGQATSQFNPLPDNAKQFMEDQQTTSQSDAMLDVISKLQEYIQGTNSKTTDTAESTTLPAQSVDEDIYAEPHGSPEPKKPGTLSGSSEQATSNYDVPQEFALSSIIQQLQQYISSNTQTTSQEDMEKEKSPVHEFKKPFEPVKRKEGKQTKADSERNQGPSQLKIVTESTSGGSPLKHVTESTQLKRVTESTSGVSPLKRFTESTSGGSPLKRATESTSGSSHLKSVNESTSGGSPLKRVTESTSSGPPLKRVTESTSGSSHMKSVTESTSGGSPLKRVTESTSGGSPLKRFTESTSGGSQLKRATESTSGGSQSKQLRTENFNTKQTTPDSKPLRSNMQVQEATLSQNPQRSIVASLTRQPDVFPELSILGDSLLQRARIQFGGSSRKDVREDLFTTETLFKGVINYHNSGRRLNSYCVLMCGANDVVNDVPPIVFVQQLKRLLNYLLTKGLYVFLVTLPLVISSTEAKNKKIPEINGMIMSFHTKPNLSVLTFHKKFQCCENRRSLFHSTHVQEQGPLTPTNTTVLSDFGCQIIREMIGHEMNGYRISSL